MKTGILVVVLSLVLIGGVFINKNISKTKSLEAFPQNNTSENEGGPAVDIHPLAIAALKMGEYPGSDLVIEQTLSPGSNYQRFIASYKSEGLKIYALLTIPMGEKPNSGWPVVIFNHGYIPPAQYKTTERYIAYTDAFSRNGYILLRSDYRGHGNSEGQGSSYGTNAYTIDVLNALSSIKRHPDADPNRIGMWGHSMGGHITLRSMVVNTDIKAGVIWAGVVASYPDMLNNWRRTTHSPHPLSSPSARGSWRRSLLTTYGTPEENPSFWDSISATSFLADISGPVQLHHGTADSSVPYQFSEKLAQQLTNQGKENELYIYEGDTHDLPTHFGVAMDRSVEFFDRLVKGTREEG